MFLFMKFFKIILYKTGQSLGLIVATMQVSMFVSQQQQPQRPSQHPQPPQHPQPQQQQYPQQLELNVMVPKKICGHVVPALILVKKMRETVTMISIAMVISNVAKIIV